VRGQFSFDYALCFDLTQAAFFLEKDYYRHPGRADAAFLIRLNDVPDLPEDYPLRLVAAPGFSPDVEKNLKQLKCLFADYSVLLIGLEGFGLDAVCAIYEGINQTGMRLKNRDILIAGSFPSNSAVAEEDFPVP
jgi:hypothetical protein